MSLQAARDYENRDLENTLPNLKDLPSECHNKLESKTTDRFVRNLCDCTLPELYECARNTDKRRPVGAIASKIRDLTALESSCKNPECYAV